MTPEQPQQATKQTPPYKQRGNKQTRPKAAATPTPPVEAPTSPQPAVAQPAVVEPAQPATPAAPPTAEATQAGDAHAHLSVLLAGYDDLVKGTEEGKLSPDQAMASLATLTVVDGAGQTWGIDEHRRFTCRPTSDAVPVLADPAQFIGVAESSQGLPASPVTSTGKTSRKPAQKAAPKVARLIPNLDLTAVKNAVKNKQESTSGSQVEAVEGLRGMQFDTRKIVLAVGIVALLIAGFLQMRGGDDPVPVTQQAAPTVSYEGTIDSAPESVASVPTVSVDDILNVVARLSSGDVEEASAVSVNENVSPSLAAVTAATWAGLKAQGASWEIVNYATDGAEATAAVRASVDGEPVAESYIVWQLIDGAFVVVNWPVPGALR